MMDNLTRDCPSLDTKDAPQSLKSIAQVSTQFRMQERDLTTQIQLPSQEHTSIMYNSLNPALENHI